jgi:hypothetical protein
MYYCYWDQQVFLKLIFGNLGSMFFDPELSMNIITQKNNLGDLGRMCIPLLND